jgi:hypothetical protein
MRSTLLACALLFPLSITWAACSGGPASNDAPGSGGGAPDGGAMPPPAADAAAAPDAVVPLTPEGICGQYIACVAATTPAGLGVVAEGYGKDGTCWKTLSGATCEAACKTGIVQTHKAYPDEEACDLCEASGDCPSQRPACDLASHKCFECASSVDCAKKSGAKACDTTTRTCVECTSNGDCTARPDRSVCDTIRNVCAMCASNADCAGGGPPVCDATTKTCRSCSGDGECPGGVCSSGACRQCRTDRECPAAAPHCSQVGTCVACVDGSTCPSGACGMSGACCDPNTCAKQSVQCGFTIDPLGCGLFTPIPCGACPGAQNCVQDACKDPPANHCGTGCAGRCGYVPESNSYECVNVSSSCNSKASIPCSAGFMCEPYKDPVTGNTVDICVDYCLVDADCKAGTCKSLSGVKGLGTCG